MMRLLRHVQSSLVSVVLFAAMLLIGVPLTLVPTGCDEELDDLSEAEMIDLCEDYMGLWCEKGFECAPAMAPALFMIPDASGCGAWAVVACTPDEDDTPDDPDDDCTIDDWPTESEIRACMSEIDDAACGEIMTVAESGICAEVNEKLECEEGGGDADADGDADGDSDSDSDSDADVEVDTAGCMAAIVASCAVSASCIGEYPRLPAAIRNGVANCESEVVDNSAALETACEAYLVEGVATSDPSAVWLEDATAAQAQACASGQTCDQTYLLGVIGGLTTVIALGGEADLTPALTPMLAGCAE